MKQFVVRSVAAARLCTRAQPRGSGPESHQVYRSGYNVILENVHGLHQAVTASLNNTRTQQDLIRSFFQRARLEL